MTTQKEPHGFLVHTTRRGQTYYLCQKRTRTGKTAYYFTRKPKAGASPVAAIPDGYEIYETPDDAQPYLRRPVPSLITELELAAVKQAVRTQARVQGFTVERERDALTIYVSDLEVDDIDGLTDDFGASASRAAAYLNMNARYTKVMRFQLSDPGKRLFSVDRWHFSGSIDDWFPLEFDKPLPALLRKYVKHLGRESFFQLGAGID